MTSFTEVAEAAWVDGVTRAAMIVEKKQREIMSWSHQDTASQLAAEILGKVAIEIRKQSYR